MTRNMPPFLGGVDRPNLGQLPPRLDWIGKGQILRMGDGFNHEHSFSLSVVAGSVERIFWEKNRAYLNRSHRATFEFRKGEHIAMTGLKNIVAFRLKE